MTSDELFKRLVLLVVFGVARSGLILKSKSDIGKLLIPFDLNVSFKKSGLLYSFVVVHIFNPDIWVFVKGSKVIIDSS